MHPKPLVGNIHGANRLEYLPGCPYFAWSFCNVDMEDLTAIVTKYNQKK